MLFLRAYRLLPPFLCIQAFPLTSPHYIYLCLPAALTLIFSLCSSSLLPFPALTLIFSLCSSSLLPFPLSSPPFRPSFSVMGLLDKLWDDVLAGPQPDSGLGRLRQKPKLPADMIADEAKLMAERRKSAEFAKQQDEARRVTQSIAIAKPAPLRVDSLDGDYTGSTPSTPSGSTPTFSSSVGSPSIFDREKYLSRGLSMPTSPALGSPGAREKENVWTSVFHPGSNKVMRKIGSEKFDKQVPNSPTVYDWLYSKDTKSSWR